MKSGKRFFLKTLRISIYLGYILISSLCLLELIYRYQFIDFYKTELEALNPNLTKHYPDGNVLVFGDSFSTFPKGYVEALRTAYPKINFINCSISGIGIRQHALFFEDRVNAFQARQILYQFYVGNDLLDIRKNVNLIHIGYLRNYYNFISDQFLVLKYINARFSVFRPTNFKPNNNETNTTYNERVKSQFLGDPYYLDETINLRGKQTQKLKKWLAIFNSLSLTTELKVNLLILPHCAQVSDFYAGRMIELGAKLKEDIQKDNYPLVSQLKKKLPHVHVLNPLSFLQEKDQVHHLYYQNDPHFNETGQEVLGAYLIDQKLFDAN